MTRALPVFRPFAADLGRILLEYEGHGRQRLEVSLRPTLP